MESYDFDITVKYKRDINLVKELLENEGLNFEIFKLSNGDGYYLSFVSDYRQDDLVDQICSSLGYERHDSLGLGKIEVAAFIKRSQSPYSTDGWGRPIINRFDETIYLGYWEQNQLVQSQIKQIIHNRYAPFLASVLVKYIDSDESGYRPYAFPFKQPVKIDLQKCDSLTDKLYPTSEEALRFGEEILIEMLDEMDRNRKEDESSDK